jgi:hypothetical protein
MSLQAVIVKEEKPNEEEVPKPCICKVRFQHKTLRGSDTQGRRIFHFNSVCPLCGKKFTKSKYEIIVAKRISSLILTKRR